MRRLSFAGDYFKRMGIGRTVLRRISSGGGLLGVLAADLAVRTWLLVALNEANRRVQFFPQKLTQAASV